MSNAVGAMTPGEEGVACNSLLISLMRYSGFRTYTKSSTSRSGYKKRGRKGEGIFMYKDITTS